MGRPKTSWSVARVALRAVGHGSTVRAAAQRAGISVTTVESLLREHGRVRLRERKARPNALTIDEREQIMLGIATGESSAAIGRRLGRHRGTIGREIAASGGREAYKAHGAQGRAEEAARRQRRTLDPNAAVVVERGGRSSAQRAVVPSADLGAAAQ